MCDFDEVVTIHGTKKVTRPSAEEVRAHNILHIPYRDWCPERVAGRGKDLPHHHQASSEKLDIPSVHFDYCFLGSEDQVKHTVLVAKERSSKMTMSTIVPMKGASEEWAVRRLLAFN